MRQCSGGTIGCVIALFILAPNVADAQTNTCFFLVGPQQGRTQRFPGVPPIRIGSPCHDGVQSRGIGTPDGDPSPVGQFRHTPLACTDIAGNRVPYQSVMPGQIPKTGLATVVSGRPVILVVTAQAPQVPPAVWTFLLAHECGHHALGQVWAAALYGVFLGPDYESAADCFALRSLRARGVLRAAEESIVMQFLSTIPGDNANYPGPIRVARLNSC